LWRFRELFIASRAPWAGLEQVRENGTSSAISSEQHRAKRTIVSTLQHLPYFSPLEDRCSTQ
jgi:hypothetical protein